MPYYLVNVKTVIVDAPLKTILSERIARLPLLLINGKTQLGSTSIPSHDPAVAAIAFFMSVT